MKRYEIIDVTDLDGVLSESAKHRIGRTGTMLKLTKGMGLRFLYLYSDNTEMMFKSSVVTNIINEGDKVTVTTLNSIYVFKLIEGDNNGK